MARLPSRPRDLHHQRRRHRRRVRCSPPCGPAQSGRATRGPPPRADIHQVGIPDRRMAPLPRLQRTHRSDQQPRQARQAHSVRDDQLPQLQDPITALRRQTRLGSWRSPHTEIRRAASGVSNQCFIHPRTVPHQVDLINRRASESRPPIGHEASSRSSRTWGISTERIKTPGVTQP